MTDGAAVLLLPTSGPNVPTAGGFCGIMVVQDPRRDRRERSRGAPRAGRARPVPARAR
jgi:hypothetical protein